MSRTKSQGGDQMATNRCFVDTVCWIALLNQDDRLHINRCDARAGIKRGANQ